MVRACLALADAQGWTCEVVVVDDASDDGTAASVQALAAQRGEVRLLRQDTWAGIAATTDAGLRAVRGDIICYLDGDGQFDPRDLPLLLQALEQADFVVGWRQRRADGASRRVGSACYNAATRAIGLRLHDVNCGFRVCRRAAVVDVLPRVQSRSSFYFAELTWHLMRAGYRVAEVPISHRDRQGGQASGASPRVVVTQFADLARFAIRRVPRP